MYRDSNYLCDRYVDLACRNKSLEHEYCLFADNIRNEEIKKADEKKTLMMSDLENYLKSFIDEKNVKLETFKLIASDLGKELSSLEKQLSENEKVVKHQESLIKSIDLEICMKEFEINEKIHIARESFLKKYSELFNTKNHYEITEKELYENYSTLMEADKALKAKKNELYQVNCCIRKYQELPKAKGYEKECEKLQNAFESISEKIKETSAYSKCLEGKIEKAEKELNLVRDFCKNKLRILTEHNQFNVQQLMKKKLSLENEIGKTNEKGMNEIKLLRERIYLMESNIEKCNEFMLNLQKEIDELNQNNGKRNENLLKSLKKCKSTSNKIVFGQDYIGSKFVMFIKD